MRAIAVENGVAYKKGNKEVIITSQMLLTSRLTPRELDTVRVRLGFDGKGIKTMEETADILNCSKARVGVLEDHAFSKLSSAYPFSTRAMSVLKEGGFLVNGILLNEKIRESTPEKIRETRGCGEKVYNEIMEYRNSLKK